MNTNDDQASGQEDPADEAPPRGGPERLREVIQRFMDSVVPELSRRSREIAEARERYDWLGPLLDDYEALGNAADDVVRHALIHPKRLAYVVVPREKVDALQDVVER